MVQLTGSIDVITLNSEQEQNHRSLGLAEGPNDPVFCSTDNFKLAKLVDGPRSVDDLLSEMYRVQDIKALYRKENLLFWRTPWLLSPSSVKFVYSDKLSDFWYGLGRSGAHHFNFAIIGYASPRQDDYARQVIYSLVKNYQGTFWEEGLFGKKKFPLVLVNLCQNDEQLRSLKERYRFVDWNRTILHKDGFNRKALRLIFDTP
jgi:hypothetical protein